MVFYYDHLQFPVYYSCIDHQNTPVRLVYFNSVIVMCKGSKGKLNTKKLLVLYFWKVCFSSTVLNNLEGHLRQCGRLNNGHLEMLDLT